MLNIIILTLATVMFIEFFRFLITIFLMAVSGGAFISILALLVI